MSAAAQSCGDSNADDLQHLGYLLKLPNKGGKVTGFDDTVLMQHFITQFMPDSAARIRARAKVGKPSPGRMHRLCEELARALENNVCGQDAAQALYEAFQTDTISGSNVKVPYCTYAAASENTCLPSYVFGNAETARSSGCRWSTTTT